MKKPPLKYEDYYVSRKTMASAIFNYLEDQGIKVNRKRGIQRGHNISGYEYDGVFVTIEKKKKK